MYESFIIVFALLIVLSLLTEKEKFVQPNPLYYKSKCFDCERQYIDQCGIDNAWKGNPAKIYATETQGKDGYIAKTIKFYEN